MRSLIPLALAAAVLTVGCHDRVEEPPAGATLVAPVAFAQVQPILAKNCAGCHGAQPKEGYDLRTYESVMKGGRKGPLVTPSNAAGSLLMQVLKGEGGHPKMPPSGPLTEGDVKLIQDWIVTGAKA